MKQQRQKFSNFQQQQTQVEVIHYEKIVIVLWFDVNNEMLYIEAKEKERVVINSNI